MPPCHGLLREANREERTKQQTGPRWAGGRRRRTQGPKGCVTGWVQPGRGPGVLVPAQTPPSAHHVPSEVLGPMFHSSLVPFLRLLGAQGRGRPATGLPQAAPSPANPRCSAPAARTWGPDPRPAPDASCQTLFRGASLVHTPGSRQALCWEVASGEAAAGARLSSGGQPLREAACAGPRPHLWLEPWT